MGWEGEDAIEEAAGSQEVRWGDDDGECEQRREQYRMNPRKETRENFPIDKVHKYKFVCTKRKEKGIIYGRKFN